MPAWLIIAEHFYYRKVRRKTESKTANFMKIHFPPILKRLIDLCKSCVREMSLNIAKTYIN